MFLTKGNLKSRFAHLLSGSSRVDIATAWATSGPSLDLLCKAAEERGVKVRAIVGIYGNATHPDVLERLRGIGELRLVEGKQGLFHPKVYIFAGDKGACAWVGSANFTDAGFARNEEAVQETQNVDGAVDWFNGRWEDCDPLKDGEIEDYRKRRRKQGVSGTLAKLVGGQSAGAGDRLELLRGAGNWGTYVQALENCNKSRLDEVRGWSVLGRTCSYVHTIKEVKRIVHHSSWVGLTDQERTMLLGLSDSADGAWSLLGTLAPAITVCGVFKHSNEIRNQRILERVKSAVAEVIKAPDDDFPNAGVTALKQICKESRFGHGTATRLLALARPDRLVSVNTKSCSGLASAFDLEPTTLGNPKNYRLLLERLYAAPWYGDRPGRSKREHQLWNMRAALLDCFVYDDGSDE